MLQLFVDQEEEQLIKEFDLQTYLDLKEREKTLNVIYTHLLDGKRAFSNNRKTQEGLLHPCTKEGYKWQFSYFDKAGPVGDTIGQTLEEMAKRILEYGFVPATEYQILC